jgi:hypothetical protein
LRSLVVSPRPAGKILDRGESRPFQHKERSFHDVKQAKA